MKKYNLKKDGTNKNVRRDVQIKLISLLGREASKARANGDPVPFEVSYYTNRANHHLFVGSDGTFYFSTIGFDGTLYMTISHIDI